MDIFRGIKKRYKGLSTGADTVHFKTGKRNCAFYFKAGLKQAKDSKGEGNMKEEYEMYETDETQLEAEHLKKHNKYSVKLQNFVICGEKVLKQQQPFYMDCDKIIQTNHKNEDNHERTK